MFSFLDSRGVREEDSKEAPRQENLRLSFLPPVFVTSLSSVFIGYMVNEDAKKGLKERKGGKSLSFYQAFVVLVACFQVASPFQGGRFPFPFSASIFTILFL